MLPKPIPSRRVLRKHIVQPVVQSGMAIKEVHFSEARETLSSIIDQIESSKTPVKILRRGKPVAVVIHHDDYQAVLKNKRPFKLAGSIKLRKDADLEKTLSEGRAQLRKAFESRRARMKTHMGS
jgi:antitoxin (DNA-binding transcriptional repressor) of toxin-antitoxin stability system